MKRKRVYKKSKPKKPTNVVDNNEEVDNKKEEFLETQNTQQNSWSNESSSDGNDSDESDYETADSSMLSSSSSSSSSSGSDETYQVEDSSSDESSDESSVDGRVRKSVKGRDKAMRRTTNSLKKSENVKVKSSKGLSYSNRKGKKSKTPRYNKKELKAALEVIKKVMEMDGAEPFNATVNPVALGKPDYFDVIDTPMDFGTICRNLQNGIKYMNSEDVFKDVQHIWENFRKYNDKGDYILDLMKYVKKKFLKYWKAAGLCSEQPRKAIGHLPTDFSKKRKKYVPRFPVGPKIGSSSHCQPQQPEPSNNEPHHMQEPLQGTSQPSQAGANIGNAAGHSHFTPPTDCAMRCNGCVNRCPLNPMVVNPSQMHPHQPPHSHGQSYESQQPYASFDQHQPSQLPASVNIGSAGHKHLSHMDSAMRGSRCAPRCSVGPVRDNAIQQQQAQFGTSQSQPQQSPQSHNQPHHSQQPTQKKRTQGPHLLRCLWDMDDRERIFVPLNKLGQPVGPASAKLSSFLGTIARDGHMAPLTFVEWREMPDANKEEMWQYVQTKFDVDPRCKSWVLMSLARKFSSWKAQLKAKHYYPHKTDEERLKDLDTRVVPDQWPILVAFWNSEKEKMRCAINKANRAKQKGATHAIGRKTFARIREEERVKRPDGKELTRAELYILTHTRKDGQPVDEEAAVTISKLRQQASQKQKASQCSDDSEDTYFQVMGPERKSRVRTYGLGPTQYDVWGSKPTRGRMSADKEGSKVLEKMEAMEQKYAQMENQLARMTSNMQKFLDKIGSTSKNLEVPGTPTAPEDSLLVHSSS